MMPYLFRPVLAIIDVDMYRVDASKRAKVKEEVCLALGPPDPTIMIEEEEAGLHLSVKDLLEVLRQYGVIVLVRYEVFTSWGLIKFFF